MWRWPPASLILALAAAAAVSCGGDGPADGDTPSGTGSSLSPGATLLAECSVDLLTEAPLTIVSGGFEVDYLADRFALATGDFNADGFDDALIGAPLADGPDDERLNSGEAYIVFGGDALPATIDAGDYDGFVIYGGGRQENLGLSVAAGDVNGDGIDDAIVGARFASPGGRENAGETYVVFGRAGLSGTVDVAAGEADVAISGVDAGDFSGIVVAANRRARAGELYVVRGSTDLPHTIDLAASPPFFTVYGASAEDALPGHLAAGDVNDDGVAELIAGVPLGTPGGDVQLTAAGLAYIIAVPPDGGSLDLASETALMSVHGARLRDSLGHSVAAADVDGDGVADIVIGARNADGPAGDRNNTGEVYVIEGGDDLPASVDLAEERPDLRITGADDEDSLGFTVATGDVTGDGTADILIGAPLGDSCGNARADAGEVYVIEGRDGLSGEIDLRNDGMDPVLFGAEARDNLGFSLAAGDVNGDGSSEIVAGALLADGPENARQEAGEAYIVDVGEDR